MGEYYVQPPCYHFLHNDYFFLPIYLSFPKGNIVSPFTCVCKSILVCISYALPLLYYQYPTTSKLYGERSPTKTGSPTFNIQTVSVISKCSFLQNTSCRQFQEPPSPGMLWNFFPWWSPAFIYCHFSMAWGCLGPGLWHARHVPPLLVLEVRISLGGCYTTWNNSVTSLWDMSVLIKVSHGYWWFSDAGS